MGALSLAEVDAASPKLPVQAVRDFVFVALDMPYRRDREVVLGAVAARIDGKTLVVTDHTRRLEKPALDAVLDATREIYLACKPFEFVLEPSPAGPPWPEFMAGNGCPVPVKEMRSLAPGRQARAAVEAMLRHGLIRWDPAEPDRSYVALDEARMEALIVAAARWAQAQSARAEPLQRWGS